MPKGLIHHPAVLGAFVHAVTARRSGSCKACPPCSILNLHHPGMCAVQPSVRMPLGALRDDKQATRHAVSADA
jgi:hypothetical protein